MKPKSCAGCKHNWYSAPEGQAWNPLPHSRCLWLNANVPMVVSGETWVSSEIPDGCEKTEQGELFA